MIEYIFLIALVLIIIPFVYWLRAKGKVGSSWPLIAVFGFIVSVFGVFVGQNFPFYYTVLIMLGLAFAFSVLLDKRVGRKSVQKPPLLEEIKEKALVNTEITDLVQTQVAATAESEDSVMEEMTDDDLELWMSTNQEDVIMPEEVNVQSGK